MYIPKSFAETDEHKLCEFIERHSFATVVSHDGGEPVASHLPLLLERTQGPGRQLFGHMAKANPHWQSADGQPTLAIFHGPHAYISPSWVETQNMVPTWNYAAVHVYGTFRLDDNEVRRLEIVRSFVNHYESQMKRPWSIDQADKEFIDKMLAAIVGFTIDIDRIEGKWKLSQNHELQRRTDIVEALQASGGENSEQIADLMIQTMKRK
jgi:transcriptional regulator